MAWGTGARDRTGTAEHRARRKRVLERDEHQCQIRRPGCLGEANILDHIIPFARGGADSDANSQSTCQPCHDWKTQQEAAEGRALRGRRRPAKPHPGLR